MNGAQAIVAWMEAAGIKYVFGMSGHTNVAVLDALADSAITFVSVRHEQVAAHMADGYFRVRHQPAVVLTTIGPGLTNTLTAVGDAALDCSALLIIAGDVPVGDIGRDSFQELALHGDASQHEAFRPFVKRAWQVYVAENLPHVLSRALNFATTGRPGPVLVDVPMDLFSAKADFVIHDPRSRRPSSSRVHGDPAAIATAADLIAQAERPLIYAGNGVLLSEASEALLHLAEATSIPVATTLIARGCFPETHPLSASYTGTIGTPVGNATAMDADVVLALGTGFSEMDTSSWDPDYCFRIPPTTLIQVDLEPTEIGKAYPVTVGVVGDIRTVLEQMTELLVRPGSNVSAQRPAWLATLAERRAAWRRELDAERHSDAFPMTLDRVFPDIRAVLPDDAILVSGVGSRHAAAQLFLTERPLSQLVASGYGTMGFATAAALGVKLARPTAPVVAVVGDGDFTAVVNPLATAVENGIAVTWVVLNNSGYNSIELYQHKHFGRIHGTRFTRPDGSDYNPDFVALAHAYGARGARVEAAADLGPMVAAALASGEPFVIDVPVTRTPRTRASGHWRVNDILAAAR